MRRALSILLFAFTAAGSVAQDWEIYDMITAGLPSNTVRALTVAPNGDVWAGTEFGLARYNGTVWDVFQAGSSGLPGNDVRALAAGPDGRIWIGTTEGFALYDDGAWTVWTSGDSPLPESFVRALAVSPGGGLWVGTSGGLAWFDGESEWHIYTAGADSYNGLELPGINITSLAVRNDGLTCVGTLNAGFTYITDTSITVYNTFDNGLPDNTALGVAVDETGNRWLACPAGALLNHGGDFIGGAWVQYSTLNSLIPTNALSAIVIDAADRHFIGTQVSGLTVFQPPNSFTTYDTDNSDLPDNEIFCLALDSEGAVWVGTAGGGAARFDYSVGITASAPNDRFITFPSPCVDRLFMGGEAPSGTSFFAVYDAVGRMTIAPMELRQNGSLNVSGLYPGNYWLILEDASHRILGRSIFAKQ